MYRKLAMVAAALPLFVTVLGGAGCYEDPNDPQTWIKKLSDPRERDTAATRLLDLKSELKGDKADPAVKGLIATYEQTKDPKFLDDALGFHSKAELPEVVKVLQAWNPTDTAVEAVAAAKSASQACAELPDASEMQALIGVLDKPTPATGPQNIVKVNAIDALAILGKSSKDPAIVDALTKVLSADTATQPIALNTHAAVALGKIGDPKAVPALIKGLFITGKEQGEQGFVMFPEAKMALVRIGAPAIPALIALLEGKNGEVEQMARDGNWEASNPGVIVWKAEAVLGDMHAKQATAELVRQLQGKSRGSVQQYALYALGRIADPSTLPDVQKFAADKTRSCSDRLHADEALVFYLDPRGEATLLANVTKPEVIEDPACSADALRADAITDYARLAGPSADLAAVQKAAAEEAELPEVSSQVNQAIEQIKFAKGCGKDAACYEKALDDPSKPANVDEALFQLARLGDKAAIAAILRVVPLRDPPTLRDASLFALEHFKGVACPDCTKVLQKIIDAESQEKGLGHLVEQASITQAYLDGQL